MGYAIYAVDLANRLILFGTESPTVISRMMEITGLPILKRIVGLDYRPSNGKLYGVGNDSRVYVIDTLTAVATPVGEQFSPKIADFFDIHFGMAFEPGTERIRLISAELGMNWSINPDDGAAIMGESPHYAAGDPHEGATPRIGGLTYVPAGAAAKVSASVARLYPGAARLMPNGPCEKLLYALDTDLGQMIQSCDPDDGDWESLGPPFNEVISRCAELKFDPGQNLFADLMRGAEALNSLYSVGPSEASARMSGSISASTAATDMTWTFVGALPDTSPIQAMAFVPAPPNHSAGVATPVQAQLSVRSGPESTTPPAQSSDPRARCPGS
jgi:Domain of unknown function (DUF4394)